MRYFYKNGEESVGPLQTDELKQLADIGDIQGNTLVRSEDEEEWRPYAELSGEALITCPNCGKRVGADDLVKVGDTEVCIHCKDDYVQRLREGAIPMGQTRYEYGGFLIRAGAYIVDSIVLWIINMGIIFAATAVAMSFLQTEQDFLVYNVIITLVTYIPGFLYFILFEASTKQATPGKMLFGLKVIREDGGRMSYAQATGRTFGKILSGLIFGIGFIMAAFDDEKRTLHDRMCNTRVIKFK